MQTKVMVALFGLFAEVERDLISERTREGLIAAKAKGKLLGRPRGSLGRSKLDGKELEIQTLLDKKVSKASIAKIMGTSRTALYNFIRREALINRPIGPSRELVEEPVTRTPPRLEPIVPDSGNRLKAQSFTWL
jgi:DNA invertase Pin-like site-specific DNA recombinase